MNLLLTKSLNSFETEEIDTLSHIEMNIKNDIDAFFVKCSINIEKDISTFTFFSSEKSISKTINERIIAPYKNFLMHYSIKADEKEFCFPYMLVNETVFNYTINHELIKEYSISQIISKNQEKLIDKTLDITVLNMIPSKILKTTLEKVINGANIMEYMGLDNTSFEKKHRYELNLMLKGIHKNISTRVKNLIFNYYSGMILSNSTIHTTCKLVL